MNCALINACVMECYLNGGSIDFGGKPAWDFAIYELTDKIDQSA